MAKIGDVCASQIDTLSAAYNEKIDYIDISAVDNREKKITQTAIVLAKDAPSRAKQLVEHGDVIVSLVRPNLNAVAIIEEQSQNLQVASTGYCVLRCNQMIYNRYLFYFCQSETFVNSMTAQATGASYPAVSNSIVKNCEIPLPERNKQKEIADILDKVTSLIFLRKQQIAKLDELVKAQFVEMFGDISNSRKVPMQDVCKIITDGTHQPPKFVLSGIPFLFVSNIVTNEIHYDAEKFISEETYNELIKRTPIEVGDVLLSTVGSYGHPAVVKENKPFCFQRHIAYLKPNHSVVNSEYLRCAILSTDLQRQIDESVKGIAQKTLNLSEIRKLRLPLPSLSLQNQFAAFVERIDQQKQTVQQSLEKLELMKKALMQEYFG